MLPKCLFTLPRSPKNSKDFIQEKAGFRKFFQKGIVLDFTDHLSDRELYCMIYRDILPAREKKLDNVKRYLHWDCTGPNGDPDVWLTFYASDEDRDDWAESYGQPLPPRRTPPYTRRLPREPGNG